MNIKAKILQKLRQQPDTPLSGQVLSDRLHISRVAVWKHLQALQSAGYKIDAGPRGYLLKYSPDDCYPWEFGKRAECVHYYDRLESSMTEARKLARAGAPAMSVVVAGAQENGRGRLDRSWFSEPGGLYFTLITRPRAAPQFSVLMNLRAAVILVKLIREQYQIDARLKWPNDVLAGGRKLCGILAEMASSGEMVSYINIGVGLNVHNPVPAVENGAVSLDQLCASPVSRRDLLAACLDEFETMQSLPLGNTDIDQWKQYALTLGKQVRISTLNGELTGRAVDLDATGALIVETADGKLKTVAYGDCQHAPLSELEAK